MITKNCLFCGEEFKTYPSINKKCCDSSCAASLVKQTTYEKYKVNCKQCGTEFLPARPKEGGLFCSYRCRGIAGRSGRLDRNGYWYVNSPDHPNSNKQGHVPEHHLVYERENNCYVECGMVIHHENGDKKDNRIENLTLMSDSEHKSLHARSSKNRSQNGTFK